MMKTKHHPQQIALRKYGWTFFPNVHRPKNNFITWLCASRKIQPSSGTLFVPSPVLRKAWDVNSHSCIKFFATFIHLNKSIIVTLQFYNISMTTILRR